MESSRAVVFATGEYSEQNASIAKVSDKDFLVGVDGGIRHCLNTGFKPDMVVGDLDSLDATAAGVVADSNVECIRFPREKDASDLELALQVLTGRSFDEVVLLGGSGGRTDHHLFNWQLAGSRSWPFRLRIIDDHVDAQLVDNTRPFDTSLAQGQLFSVIPLAAAATGVHVRGAQYPLDDATLALGSTIGLSNVVTQPRLQVSVEAGIVFVMLVLAE